MLENDGIREGSRILAQRIDGRQIPVDELPPRKPERDETADLLYGIWLTLVVIFVIWILARAIA